MPNESTCPALFARTGRWTETVKRNHLNNDHHPDGCVIRADCEESSDLYDVSISELSRAGYGAQGWDMWLSGQLVAKCAPDPVEMEQCECGTHIHPDRWEDHECYVTRGEAHLAQMMG